MSTATTTQRPADRARWLRLACAALKEQRVDEAIAAAEQSLAIAPSFDAWTVLGASLARRDQFSDALPCYLQALALDPKSVACWADLGELYLSLLDYDKAAQALRQAIELDPTASHPSGRRARAVVGRTLALLRKR